MTAGAALIDDRPGYRRRFRITPQAGRATAELEDDYHCMTVTLDHADGMVTGVTAIMHRAPWSTCPGAEAKLVETFVGHPLAAFSARGEKRTNCTHLHDLALLAAAHAGDAAVTVYDVLRSDPVAGEGYAEVRRNGAPQLGWTLAGFEIVAPPEWAGLRLDGLQPMIEQLAPAAQEAARLLRWGATVAHGRMIPLADQSDARRMPPNCYTFQPDRAVRAQRVGEIRDFSSGDDTPLDGRARVR